jgi:hypothetical protein
MATTVQPRPEEGTRGRQNLVNKAYKFDIYADNNNGNGPVTLSMQPGDEATRKHLKGKHLGFPYGTDWYDISYSLDDSQSTVKVKFKELDANGQSGPICVQEGTDCPADGSGNNSNSQICIARRTDKKLDVQNKNQNQQVFSYTLFFTDMDGNDVGNIDPIYDNSGGGHTLAER